MVAHRKYIRPPKGGTLPARGSSSSNVVQSPKRVSRSTTFVMFRSHDARRPFLRLPPPEGASTADGVWRQLCPWPRAETVISRITIFTLPTRHQFSSSSAFRLPTRHAIGKLRVPTGASSQRTRVLHDTKLDNFNGQRSKSEKCVRTHFWSAPTPTRHFLSRSPPNTCVQATCEKIKANAPVIRAWLWAARTSLGALGLLLIFDVLFARKK